jgi:hypothetical protein
LDLIPRRWASGGYLKYPAACGGVLYFRNPVKKYGNEVNQKLKSDAQRSLALF